MPMVVYYVGSEYFFASLWRVGLFWADMCTIADNVSGDVETSAYASEYSKY